MNRLSLFALVLLAACGPNKNNFAGKLTEVTCERLQECALGTFEALYTSVDDCIARSGADGEELATCFSDHCEFDKANADQCLTRVEAADCDEIVDGSAYSDCAEVWTNCEGEDECVTGGTTPTGTDDSGTTPTE